MKWIVSMEWLSEHREDSDIVIADCRFSLSDPSAGRRCYEEGHIPHAIYCDLDKDLSGAKGKHGGRHPLPDIDAFAVMLGSRGIDHSTKVVAYDDQGGAMASRLWWLLHYAGHKEAYVMDGGFSQWKSRGYAVDAKAPIVNERQFAAEIQPQLLASMEEVGSHLGEPNRVIVDSREEARYKGISEPIDPVAGHIPGALNRFWKDGLDAEGNWKRSELQKARFEEIDPGSEIIVYCGSGVTACPNIVALTEAGYAKVKLYAGSWSDWISYEGNPIATGEE